MVHQERGVLAGMKALDVKEQKVHEIMSEGNLVKPHTLIEMMRRKM